MNDLIVAIEKFKKIIIDKKAFEKKLNIKIKKIEYRESIRTIIIRIQTINKEYIFLELEEVAQIFKIKNRIFLKPIGLIDLLNPFSSLKLYYYEELKK
jgi:hypothetical protein